jgi:hypothetical protein
LSSYSGSCSLQADFILLDGQLACLFDAKFAPDCKQKSILRHAQLLVFLIERRDARRVGAVVRRKPDTV